MNKYLGICFILLALVVGNAPKAMALQPLNDSEILSIVDYAVVSSSIDGDILTRTISLVVKSKMIAPLHHVYVRLDSMPAHVTGGGALYFPELEPGVITTSNNTLVMTVDLARQKTPDLELVWQIEAEIDGESKIDEIAVVEPIL